MSQWNVNNWHWEESNYTEWATSKLKELYNGYKYEKDGIELTTNVDSISGNAYVNVRKGKKIYGYDIKLTLKFKATDIQTFDCAEGEITFVDLDDFTPIDDVKINMKFKKDANKELSERVKSAFTVKTFISNFQTFLEEYKTK